MTATGARRRCRYEVPWLSYDDIKIITELKLENQERGILTEQEISSIVKG